MKSRFVQIMLILFLILSFGVCIAKCGSLVTTEQGVVAGISFVLPNKRTVSAFLGVPYAAPPIGQYRFKEPKYLEPWTGIWNASVIPSACLQVFHFTYSVVGEEDCLYLNIYTSELPKNDTNPLLDVLIFFHGGGFMFGNGGAHSPDYIMQDNDLVFVSVNYRLGVLGFFSTDDDVVPGNNGLKDQVAALRWLQRNVVKFGGNPASITLMGNSAGGTSVHYHYLSPLSEGLFQRGISLSGTALPPWTLPRNNREKSIHLASLVGCASRSSYNMIKCLQSRSGRQLVVMTTKFQPWRYSPFTVFGPVVEPKTASAFLSEEPINLLSNGKIKNFPWLISLTAQEGLYPAADFIGHEKYLQELNVNWDQIAPHLFMYNYSVPNEVEKRYVSATIKTFYFGSKDVNAETIPKIIEALGDRLFYNDIMRAVKLHASVASQNVHCFLFNYRGKYSSTNDIIGSSTDYGVSHVDDLSYVLKFLSTNSRETDSDMVMSTFLSSLICQFMKTGNPKVDNLLWVPVSKNRNDSFRCLNINTAKEQKMGEISKDRAAEFWKNLLPIEYPFNS